MAGLVPLPPGVLTPLSCTASLTLDADAAPSLDCLCSSLSFNFLILYSSILLLFALICIAEFLLVFRS